MDPQCCRGCLMELNPSEVYSFQWPEIKKLFEECTNLKIPSRCRPDENQLPLGICGLCYAQCEEWKKFRTMCHEINKFINSSLFPKPLAVSNPFREDETDWQSDEEMFEEEEIFEEEPEPEDVKPKLFSHKLGNRFNPVVVVETLSLDSLRTEGRKLKISGLKTCPLCSALVPSLYEHLAGHIARGQKHCPICSLTFHDGGAVKRHMVVHTDELPFPCRECPRKFSQKYELKVHVKRRHNRSMRPNREGFRDGKIARKPHQMSHRPQIPTTTTIVPKTKAKSKPQSMSLNHQRVEVKVELKKCPLCPRKVRSLMLHLTEKHVQPGEFKCPLCHVDRENATILNRHLVTHTNERFYVCKFCDRSYKSGYTLIQHLKAAHPKKMDAYNNWVKQECGVCEKKFSSVIEFEAHVLQHDEKVMAGPSRSQQANTATRKTGGGGGAVALEDRRKESAFRCQRCRRTFGTSYLLKKHMWTHKEKRN